MEDAMNMWTISRGSEDDDGELCDVTGW